MRFHASLAAVAAVLFATAAGAADPTLDLKSGVTRLQQAQPGVRQGLTGLQAVSAGWDKTTSRFAQFVSQLEGSGGAVDPNALVQYVLRESYLQTTEDLRFYAEKVKYFNEQKKLIRDHLRQLRDADARLKLDQAAGKLDAQDAALEQLREHLKHRAARLQALSPNGANIIAILIGLLREAIKETNEDKKYYLQRLQELNAASASLNAELKKLADASSKLSDEERKVKRP